MEPTEIQAAWQSQPWTLGPGAPPRFSRYARNFSYWRLVETLVSVPMLCGVTLLFAAAAVFGELALCRIGCAMIAASHGYAASRLLRFYWGLDNAADCLTHYREILARRRDLLRGSSYWGSLLTGSGAVLAALGWVYAEPDRWFDAASAGILGVCLQLALGVGNSRVAGRLQQEIDRLDVA